MGLRRVLLLAEVLSVSVEVPGFFVWPGALGLEVEPIGVLPAVSGLAGSGADSVGGRHAATRRGPAPRDLFRPLDLLRQLRRLPDPYAIVARGEGASCQLIVGKTRN
jgi:hypothetical protein